MRRVEEDTYVLCEQHFGLLKASRPLMFGNVTLHEEHAAGADDECYMCAQGYEPQGDYRIPTLLDDGMRSI